MLLGFVFEAQSKKKLEPIKKNAPVVNKIITHCTRQGEPAETGLRTKYLCGDGKKKFLAYCDLNVDPLEFNQSKLEIVQAKWAKHGKAEGIEGSFGFIVCKK